MKNGIYSANVKYYYLTYNSICYEDGVTSGGYYSVSDEEATFVSDFFGNNIEVTAEDGTYTLKFTPVVDHTDSYYFQNMTAYVFDTSSWKGSLTKTRTSVAYGSGTKKFFTTADSVTGTITNLYPAEGLMFCVATYPVETIASSSTQTYIAVSIDWDTITRVSGLPTDKSTLETLIGSTNNLINNNLLTAYTDASIANLKTVLADAETVNNSDESTQTEIDTAAVSLQTAISSLEQKVSLAGYTAELADYVGLNYYLNISDELKAENPYVVFTYGDGQTQTVTLDEATATDSMGYKFTVKLDPKQMADTVTAEVYAGDEKVPTTSATTKKLSTTVKAYADTIIANADSSYSDAAVATAKALLNYGGYTQVLFSYNTDALANASLDSTDVSSVTADTVAAYKAVKSGSDDTAKIKGYNLYLDSLTKMRFYYTGDVTVSANAENYTTGKDSKGNYVEITGITPANLTTSYDVTIGGITVSASPASYAYTALNKSSDENLLNAMKAMILYSEAASAYVASLNA